MTKILKVILSDYKKANKQRRLALLARYGYKNEKEFLKEFENGTVDQTLQDMVIVFDTTGSMASYINNVKEHIKELIPKMFKANPGLRMRIVATGDYCDMKSPTVFGKAYQESEFTNNENELIHFVNNAQGTSGGDSDEFYELIIKKVVEETPWREGSKRSVLMIADYTPHPLGYEHFNLIGVNQIDWRKEAKKANSFGIQFDTLKIIPQHTWYDELSKITGGVCLDFQSSNKMANLMETVHYARSGTVGGASAFVHNYDFALRSKDSELIGAYKSLTTLDSGLADLVKEADAKFSTGTTSVTNINKTETK